MLDIINNIYTLAIGELLISTSFSSANHLAGLFYRAGDNGNFFILHSKLL